MIGAGGEDVDMAVEHQVRRTDTEFADDVRQVLAGMEHLAGRALAFQMVGDEGGHRPRVAGRVGARDADERGEEAHERVAVLLDPGEDLLFDR